MLHRLIGHTTMYFSQRRPYELGAFAWIVDGKDPRTVTKWEEWWSYYAQGALATMSKKRPSPRLSGGDYSFYDRSFGVTNDDGETGTDLKLLLKDIRFSAKTDVGLEFVDILSNAIRRALTRNLQKGGWKNIRRLMVHRNETYLQFILLREGQDAVPRASYANVVHEGFSSHGKSMLTPSNCRLVEKEIAESGG